MAVVPVGIALGSNLGDRVAELDAAIAFLRSLSVNQQLRESPRFETAPVECPPGSGPFLNAVAEIEVDFMILPPRALFTRLKAFESGRGRLQKHKTNAPRPLDLDLLYYGDAVIQEPDLIVPHPRLAERRFVLEPLSHLRPDLVLPGQTRSVQDLLKRLMS